MKKVTTISREDFEKKNYPNKYDDSTKYELRPDENGNIAVLKK